MRLPRMLSMDKCIQHYKTGYSRLGDQDAYMMALGCDGSNMYTLRLLEALGIVENIQQVKTMGTGRVTQAVFNYR